MKIEINDNYFYLLVYVYYVLNCNFFNNNILYLLICLNKYIFLEQKIWMFKQFKK